MTFAVLTAAAIHGGIFFGIPKSPVPARPAKEEPKDVILIQRLIPEREELILAPPDEPQPKGNPDAYRPVPDDVVVVAKPDDFIMPDVPAPLVDFEKLRKLPSGSFGMQDGIETNARPPILRQGLLDNPPRTRVQIPPHYPFEKKKEGISAEVQVEFTVDEAGFVIEPRVVHSTDRGFDEATLQAVRKWRFEPGRRNGRIVRFQMMVPVRFSLND